MKEEAITCEYDKALRGNVEEIALQGRYILSICFLRLVHCHNISFCNIQNVVWSVVQEHK